MLKPSSGPAVRPVPRDETPPLYLLDFSASDEASRGRLARLQAQLQGSCEVHLVDGDAQDAGFQTGASLLATDAQALLAWLQAAAGRGGPVGPVSLACAPPAQEQLDELARLGLSGWWPDQDLATDALAASLRWDRTRWRLQQEARDQHEQMRGRLDDRKWVDRAKGVLMAARAMSEDEAFSLLRTTSMHANLRLGELARGVIEAALWAEAVNRAGQLRMLSQRLVKLLAQRMADVDPRGSRQAQDEAADRLRTIQEHLQALVRESGQQGPGGAAPAWVEDVARVEEAWAALQACLGPRTSASLLRKADAQAEALLAAAERLTGGLEAGSHRRSLRIINLCGRQRMVVQRVAKQALLQALGSSPGVEPGLLDQFESALRELQDSPISTADIRAGLAGAGDEWQRLLRALAAAPAPDALRVIARSSDALLGLMDRLTSEFEHSLQVILS